MKFYDKTQMSSIFDIENVSSDVSWVYNYFMEHDDEVLYFLNCNRLYAVCSIGDLARCLNKSERVFLNKNFTCVTKEDIVVADDFFRKHPTIHEVPVVNSKGELIGKVCSEKGDFTKNRVALRADIKRRYYNIEKYYEDLVKKFVAYFKGTILYADLPNDKKVFSKLKTDKEKELYQRRVEISPISILLNMDTNEEKLYWGGLYKKGISKRFVEEFQNVQIYEKNGCKRYEANEGMKYFTFRNGRRCVVNSLPCERKIYLVGPCTVFGSYVADEQTIEYYLQQYLNESSYQYEVVNYGTVGLCYEFQYLLTKPIGEEDIVIILTQIEECKKALELYINAKYIGDLSDVYDDVENPLECVLDTFRHSNYKISQKIAKYIYDYIKVGICRRDRDFSREINMIPAIQSYFVSWDIISYYKDFVKENHLECQTNGTVGTIVMNCNPFTKGHKYLIEYAAKQVDKLIIFVVEEDASFFLFQDRYAMAQRGTADILNTIIVPSGKYNISKSTFAQYFEKDKIINKLETAEYDLRVFCEAIVPLLKISVRFVGEEPNDIVTRNYNEAMKRILPEYHIKVIEIPRLMLENCSEYISGSKVREYAEQRNWEELEKYLPISTLTYLQEIMS